jgi:serine-type D-Ala-D-Ala carboxypeptidase/endopeptidase (penicillin-binding protein 4)
LRRLTRLATVLVAALCVFTIVAGVTVSRLLPGRLRIWQPARITAASVAQPTQVLGAGDGRPQDSDGATAAGVSRAIAPLMTSATFGPQFGALVTDLSTGQVLYSANAATGFAPASTAKLATAVAALTELGPAAKFRTSVVTGSSPAAIVLVGGGDPTLAAGRPPASDYPQPATLLELARSTAHALAARGRHSVQLNYDASLYSGPGLAAGWSQSYVTTGNVSVITPLEVDQGRLTARGVPEDADEADVLPRSADPAAEAAAVFARYLRADGIAVRGAPQQTAAKPGAVVLASVDSPPLAEIIQWMLEESNNVIAENLARHVAIATGRPASFTGAAAAVTAVLRRLGISSGVQLYDGSGLSVDDRITPQALVHLIRLAAARGQVRSVLTSLPVANFSGTLTRGASVFPPGGLAAHGAVRAKTGNLDSVAALAGIAYAKNGQLLAFAVMANKLRPNVGPVSAASGMVRLATVLASCGCR